MRSSFEEGVLSSGPLLPNARFAEHPAGPAPHSDHLELLSLATPPKHPNTSRVLLILLVFQLILVPVWFHQLLEQLLHVGGEVLLVQK